MFIRMMLQEILVISKALATLLAKIGFFATLKAGEKLTMNSILHFSCRHCFDHGAVFFSMLLAIVEILITFAAFSRLPLFQFPLFSPFPFFPAWSDFGISFFSFVYDPYMSIKGRPLLELFPTLSTRKVPLFAVNQLVLLHVILQPEAFSTLITFKWSFAVMRHFMPLHVVFSEKCFVTLVALYRSNFSLFGRYTVSSFMASPVGRFGKIFVAMFAFVRFSSVMRDLVTFEKMATFEGLSTMITSEGSFS